MPRKPCNPLGLPLAALALLMLAGCGPDAQPSDSDPDNAFVSVQLAGAGTGNVVSDPAGIDCGEDCESAFDVGTSVDLSASPAAGSSFAGWDGCDELAGATCSVDVASDRAVTATFDAEAPATFGALQVGFSGLPGPWPDAGYALLVGPDDDETPVLDTTTLTDLPTGDYRLDIQPLPICGVGYLPQPATLPLQIEADATAVATIDYAPAASGGLQTEGYRASVVGVHSNSNNVRMYVTLVQDAGRLVAFGCTVSSIEPAGFSGADVRDGNVKNFFVEDAPIVATFDVGEESCETDGGRMDDCKSYVSGAHDLAPDEVEALGAGGLYLRVGASSANGSNLLAQIVPDAGDPSTGVGGDLEVLVDTTGMPQAVRDVFAICVEGRFELGLADGYCTSEDAIYTDLYSGSYEAFLSGFGLNDEDFEIGGDPAEVRPGTTATIEVRYVGPD